MYAVMRSSNSTMIECDGVDVRMLLLGYRIYLFNLGMDHGSLESENEPYRQPPPNST